MTHLLQKLKQLKQIIEKQSLTDLFQADSQRAKRYTLNFNDLYIDFSKNFIDDEILNILFKYAEECHIFDCIESLYLGDKINVTESKAALHTALRGSYDDHLIVDDVDISLLVHNELKRIRSFVEKFHAGHLYSHSGSVLDTIVHIGIGGSHIGPQLVISSCQDIQHKIFFVSHLGSHQLDKILSAIDSNKTLFVISSKSFLTMETLHHAKEIWHWLQDCGCQYPQHQFIAVTNNIEGAIGFGVKEENCFQCWDWVGGRFSLWSAIGISIALAISYEYFEKLLLGARKMDNHFRIAPLDHNLPVIMGLLDFWYAHFFDAKTHAYIPYDYALTLLPDYLAQLMMESNGKSVDLDGKPVSMKTMPVIWGATGGQAQHSFMQLFHQGTQFIPVDFMTAMHQSSDRNHALSFSHCLAQSYTLMVGKEHDNDHYCLLGNHPSTTIFYPHLTPECLGSLLAFFEHRTYVLSVLWNINAFDQCGVLVGKEVAEKISNIINNNSLTSSFDPSTENLLKLYRKFNQS